MIRLASRRLLQPLTLALALLPASAQAATIWECNGSPVTRPSSTVTIRASSVSFPDGHAATAGLQRAIECWNRNPSLLRFDLVLGDDDIGWKNGESEIWFTNNDDLLKGNTANSLLDFDGCTLVEVDIVFDASAALPYPYLVGGIAGAWSPALLSYGGPFSYFESTVVHELGHALGLHHENRFYNVMGENDSHVHANGWGASTYPGEDASWGARYLYGPPVVAFTDLAVSHWKFFAESDLFLDTDEYSLHRRTAVFQADGSMCAVETDPFPDDRHEYYERFVPHRYLVDNGAHIKPEFTYENLGSTTIENIHVGFALSPDRMIDASDRWIGSTVVNLGPDVPFTLAPPYACQLPDDLVPEKEYFIGAVIDSSNSIAEVDESNNATYTAIRVNRSIPISLTCTPDAIMFGGTSTGRVDLSAPAHPGGAIIELTGRGITPDEVFIPHGDRVAEFEITTEHILCAKPILWIDATHAGVTVSARVSIIDHREYPLICDQMDRELQWLLGIDRCVGPIGGGRWQCAIPDSCPECFFGLDGRPVRIPPILLEIHGAVLELLRVVRDGGRPRPILDDLLAVLQRAPAGGEFTARNRLATIQTLKRIRDGAGVTIDTLETLVGAVNALELDAKLPTLKPSVVTSDEARSAIDFGGVVRITGAEERLARSARLTIEPGMQHAMPGFEAGWPVLTYRIDFEPPGEAHAGIDVSINLRGLDFAGDPSTLRMFEWDGKSYRDITTQLDLHEQWIHGRVRKATSLVVMSERPGTGPRSK